MIAPRCVKPSETLFSLDGQIFHALSPQSQLHVDNVSHLLYCPCLYSVLVDKDALRNGKRFFLNRTHVGNEIQQFRPYKTKKCKSWVSVFLYIYIYIFEAVAKHLHSRFQWPKIKSVFLK